MLDRYLKELEKEAAAQDTSFEQQFSSMSAEELAKVAGITLPENCCPKCASIMEKQGSILHCTCGMMKKAFLGFGGENKESRRLKSVMKPGMSSQQIVDAYNKKYSKTKKAFHNPNESSATTVNRLQAAAPQQAAGIMGANTNEKQAGLGNFLVEHPAAIAIATGLLGGAGAAAGTAIGMGSSGRRQVSEEFHDPRLYSNLRGAVTLEPRPERVAAYAQLPGVQGSILDAMRTGFGRRKEAAKHDMPHFTDQNRPEKVKDIFKALKRDHPNMPAEVKARIAYRKGKASPESRKSPADGGPKYKAPLHFTRKGESYKAKTSAQVVLDKVASFFVQSPR
jgi:hypothetical protein